MLKICKEQWSKNEKILRKVLEEKVNDEDFYLEYKELVEITIKEILNNNSEDVFWDIENITEIDNGDYQGTLLYLIPEKTYQPSEYEYLMTYADYGTCSGCDTLDRILYDCESKEEQVNDLMTLCRDLITRIVKPYNSGWRYEEGYDEIEEIL